MTFDNHQITEAQPWFDLTIVFLLIAGLLEYRDETRLTWLMISSAAKLSMLAGGLNW